MIKKPVIAVFLLVLLVFTTVGRTEAQTLLPGVRQGNTFYYSFDVFWSSTDPKARAPENLIDLNRTEWLQVVVTAISGPMVYLNIAYRFENGTEKEEAGYINIDTGRDVNGFGMVIAPNLDANDVVYPSGNNSFTLTQTIMRTYPDGARETNRFMANSTDIPGWVYVYHDIYFDKKTGIMVEWYTERVASSSPNEKIALRWKIKESNVWVIPEFPSLLILPLFMLVTVLAVLIYRKQRMGHLSEKTAFTKIHAPNMCW